MGYLIFKNVSTRQIPGIAISKMPSHKRAAMRYTEYYVKGRDGALHIDEGYSNIELQATIVLLDARAETRQMLNNWATGTGKLITSDDPSKAFKASVKREIKYTRVPGNKGYFDTAVINFDCDPYMYEADESVIEYTATGTISNPGTAVAIPLIEVRGSGNVSFTVGGQQVTVKSMSSGVPAYLDCENGYVYAQSGAMEMIGEFPEIPMGQSQVVLGTNATKLTLTPHWRWI